MARIDDLKQELSLTRRRLAGLRNQKAQFGAKTDPGILIEIDDLQARARELEAQLGLAPGAEVDQAQPPQPRPQSSQGSKFNIEAPGAQIGAMGEQVTVQGGVHFHNTPASTSPPPPQPPRERPARYDLAKVKDLLIDTFSEQEMREFCLVTPEFQAVYHNLKETDRTSQVLHQLLEFAQRKGLVPRLLEWARAESPDRYAEGEPYEGEAR